MGGSSKSSSTQKTTQNNAQASADGVVTGGLNQSAGDLTINDYFPSDVASAFGKLIDLTASSLQTATDVGQAAITAVSDRSTTATNPELTALNKLIPVAMIGIVALAAVFIWRKR